MKKSWALLSVLALSACQEESSQRAEDIFADRKDLPAPLDTRANPKPNAAQTSAYLSAQPTKHRVSVAVIDNGLDYMHPSLINQVRFTINGSTLAGAGHDLLGGDEWSNPALINPSFYALTSNVAKDGRLSGTTNPDPLSFWIQLSNKLVKDFLVEMKKDPDLSKSLFADRINDKNIDLLILREISKSTFDKETYDKRVAEKTIHSKIEDHQSKLEPRQREAFDERNWEVSEDLQTNEIVSDYEALEFGDKFYALAKKMYESFDKANKVEDRLNNYVTFMQAEDPKDAIEALHTSAVQVMSGFQTSSPMKQALEGYCKSLKTLASGPIAPADLKAKSAKYFDDFFANYTEYLHYKQSALKTKDADSEKLKALNDDLEHLPLLQSEFKRLAIKMSADTLSCDPAVLAKKIDKAFLKQSKATLHPYFDPASAAESHGSHTSGIIMRQSPNIVIYPVRVVTATSKFVKARADRVRASFNTGFNEWLKNTAVANAFADYLTKQLGEKITASSLPSVMNEYLDTAFKSDYLNFMFFDEILDSIKAVGDQKIKVASMSLGTGQEQDVASNTVLSRKEKIARELKFVTTEYFKFRVGEAIDKYAAKTLFVIAAGNDGKWVDGKSRSALPCDISSPFLKHVPGGDQLANNRIHNILCVGSINPNDEISSFSNLPITDVPFVFGYGEAILSAVKLTDCEGNEQEVRDRLGNDFDKFAGDMPDLDDSSGDDFFIKKGWMKSGLSGTELQLARSKIMLALMEVPMKVLEKVGQAVVVDACQSSPRPYARMSGTSMATPAVAGFIARKLVIAYDQAHINESEAYDRPDFTPEQIIKDVQTHSPKYGGESVIKEVPKVVKMKTWDNIVTNRLQKLGATQDQIKKHVDNVNASPILDMRTSERNPTSVNKLKKWSDSKDLKIEKQNKFWPST